MTVADQLLKLVFVATLAVQAGCSDPSKSENTAAPIPEINTLVSAQWLKEHLGDPDLVVLDATVIVESDAAGNFQSVNGRANYEAGHIPMAGFANLMGELSNVESPFQFGMPSPELIADQEEVRASIENDAVNLVDALPEVHYRGEWMMYDQPGHIPDAVNVPVTSLFDETGRFRTDTDLSGFFVGDRDARTITYCGGGIAAAADAFVLTRLGFTDVAIYAASLEEWTANPDNPMEIDLEEIE